MHEFELRKIISEQHIPGWRYLGDKLLLGWEEMRFLSLISPKIFDNYFNIIHIAVITCLRRPKVSVYVELGLQVCHEQII